MLFAVSTALMVVPPVVMLMPLFILFTDLSLVSTYQGVILIYAGLTLPFSIVPAHELLPRDPERADRVGRHRRRTHCAVLVRIVLPLSAPALVTLVVVNASGCGTSC